MKCDASHGSFTALFNRSILERAGDRQGGQPQLDGEAPGVLAYGIEPPFFASGRNLSRLSQMRRAPSIQHPYLADVG
jgi:hypothetical protein